MSTTSLGEILARTSSRLEKSDRDLVEKISSGHRLNFEEGLRLYQWPHLNLLGALANEKREHLHGNVAYFIQNQHLNNTNICVLHCQFCSFRRSAHEEGAYSYTPEEIYARIRATVGTEIREIHIVNGLHPHLKIDFYEEVLREIKKIRPELHLKAFTAVEIDFFARRDHLAIETVLRRLREAGLDSLPGGGAEIFSEKVRPEICGEKIEAERWLEIHEIAHGLGIPSTCTMLYGHIETLSDRIDHLERLRNLQDKTGGFTCFIPLRFHVEGNPLGKRPEVAMSEMLEDLRNYAVCRLYFDNIPHLKAYWIMAGCDTARLALSYGCDDLDGTVTEEIITHMAGCESPVGLTKKALLKMIAEAGREARERDSLYRTVASPTLESHP
jgi:aminodeoxyfutalosine synthase